jgi:malonate transporter
MSWADHAVVASLVPVVLLIAVGWTAGRLGWIRESAVKDLSNLVFLVLIPALLFRTMSGVRWETLDARPIAAYFTAALGLLALLVMWRGFEPRSIVLALGAVFSNMVMIGITLIGLAYGQQGLVTLLTLVSVHALVLLTVGSVMLELAQARSARQAGAQATPLWRTALSALRAAVIHPIPLPIMAGLLYAQTGWAVPAVVDKPLHLLGQAFGPLALVLVGVNLAATPLAGQWRDTLALSATKNLVLPVLVALSAWAWGINGLPLVVMVTAAALPMGANVFLFAQRYQVAQTVITAGMGVSTALALLTLSGWMLLLQHWLG